MRDGGRYTVFFGIWKNLLIRLKRLLFHFTPNSLQPSATYKNGTWRLWLIELILLIFDLMGMPDLIMQARLILRPGIRALNVREKKMITEFYGELPFLNCIWMNSQDILHFRKFAHAYVLHNSINYHQSIKDSVLIHEIMHVIQYHLVGSVYIIRALKAQQSAEGYQYGGPEVLYKNMLSGISFWHYNYEQQAQILQDLYDLKSKSCTATNLSLVSYQILLNEVKEEVLNI